MCDTLCVVGPRRVLFGKNSDREPGEAQAVEVVPPRRGLGGAVRCTYLEVPQVSATRGVLLSRPVWMWGCEMGANDAGVVGGNEAVFTRLPVEAVGLTGMDLLRLALERASTAREAVEVVVELLADSPQGGGMGFSNRRFRYHSSFIFADAAEGWVLETAGRLWAAERVRGVRTISNALTIGTPELVHPEAADEARRRGWLKPGEVLDFARCFGRAVYRTLTGGPTRQACTAAALRGATEVRQLKAALRDHRGRHPSSGLVMVMPCAHASWEPTRHAGQTQGSMVSSLEPGAARHWLTGTSSPCLSVFKPAAVELEPGTLGPSPGQQPEAGSLFWRHEALHRAVLGGFEARRAAIDAERLALEGRAEREGEPRGLWEEHRERVLEWRERVNRVPPSRSRPLFDRWWRAQPAPPARG